MVRATIDVPGMNGIRRYRECRECSHRWITYETTILEVVTKIGRSRASFISPEEFERIVLEHLESGGE